MSLAIDIFYDELSDLLDQPIYIAETLDDLEKEVTDNTHGLAVNLSVINDVNDEDLLHFVSKLKDGAVAALNKTNVASLRFYLWHEEGQLWYSFVNAGHERMPFAKEFEVAVDEAEVVESYLSSLRQEEKPGKMYINFISRS